MIESFSSPANCVTGLEISIQYVERSDYFEGTQSSNTGGRLRYKIFAGYQGAAEGNASHS